MIVTLQTLIFFRESLLNALNKLLQPYYKKLSITFGGNGDVSEDEETEEQVFAEYDNVKGVVFYPPVYIQRYAAVSDCLMDERWSGKLEKVVDIGYHDMSFIKYLKEVPGINCILGVDIETFPLRCSSDLIGCNDYVHKRENPLQITLFKGNAADPDYRLIGCDAVVAIEMIEHMLPHDLERLIHTVFGFIKPRIAIFTTPNGDFNVLFKSLEKNGLRRLDHFFEWSREQFHDWCSNIALRYPQYTVSCKGIGPGPPDTKHLGCCSQMALFVANEYTKQQDLNLDSLALVSNTHNEHSINNLISSWDVSETPNEMNMITPINNIESFSELSSEKQSYLTIMHRTPTYSVESLASTNNNILLVDKTSQCNLDSEISKNYLMFDYDQMCFSVVVPRRNVESRVYFIEDVYSRLNCTTSKVTKFTKTTQNLMAKNKLDSLVHTREVVDEIRHLRNMLNFNKDSLKQITGYGDTIWCNINWGENAPYWNQYYKIIREYHYPFESKSDECRILELISDEINRVVDAHNDEDFMDMNQLEIPIGDLMSAVDHITNDVDKVKELLEWNGYEVCGDVVVYSRLVVDNTSDTQDDWQETDSFSDWESTDLRSTSTSDGSTNVQDYHARCLRRVLDKKVRKLRSMLTTDADITTELDQVVCRLMKLALHTSKGREQPPPAKWMQCKLLDLLTLTEKSIERKKRQLIESCPYKAISYGEDTGKVALKKIRDDDTALKIVDKYLHLVKHSDESQPKYGFIDTELEDDLSVSSVDFLKDYDLTDGRSPSLNETEDYETIDTIKFNIKDLSPKTETSLERTQAWLEGEVDIVPYADHNDNNNYYSEDLEKYVAEIPKYEKRYKENKGMMSIKSVTYKKSRYNTIKRNKFEVKYKEKCTKTKLIRKVPNKKFGKIGSGKNIVNKCISVDSETYVVKPKKHNYKTIYPTASKPIPHSLVKLCHPELMVGNIVTPYNVMTSDIISNKENQKRTILNYPTPEVALTKQSMLISIVTEEYEEIVALRRTVGTDAEVDPFTFEEETLIRSISNSAMNDDIFKNKHNITTENVHSQTIFLYDINEPTTSKGVRHVSMDVQCGTDTSVPGFSILSPTTSLFKMPELCSKNVKIRDATTANNEAQDTDCSNRTSGTENIYKTITGRDRSVGIKIIDSHSNIPMKTDNCYVATDIQIEISNCVTSAYNTLNQHNDIIPIARFNNITNYDNSDIITPQKQTSCQFITAVKDIHRENTNSTDRIVNVTCTKHETVNKCVKMKPIEQNINSYNASTKTIKEIIGCDNYSTDNLDSHVYKEIVSFTNKRGLCGKSDSSQKMHSKKEGTLNEYSDSKGNKILEICRNTETFVQMKGNCVQSNKVAEIILPKAGNAISEKLKTKLCPGGIQVHSYRDQQTSEDVMYQGGWRINRPKVFTWRKKINPLTSKKISDSYVKGQLILKESSRHKHIYKSNSNPERKSLLPISNSQLTHLKQDCSKYKTNRNNSNPTALTRTNRQFRNVMKVPSKVTMSSVFMKNPKSELGVKEPSSSSTFSVAKDNELRSKILNKNYLPLYLRRRLLKSANDVIKNNLNVSFDSAELTAEKEKSTKKLARSKTIEIDRELLKFQYKAPISKFVVLQNEIETKNSSIAKGQAKNSNVKTGNTRKQRQLSPQSGNSSTCSSPNSLATVKAVSPRTTNVANRKLSKSTYECSTANSRLTTCNSKSPNTLPDENRKSVRESKSAKRTTEKVFENKENIPQTSKHSSWSENMKKKPNDLFGIETYMGQKQSVYTANMTRSSHLQINNVLSKNKSQKSNVSPSRAETNSNSFSKTTSFKSDVSFPAETNITGDSQRSQTSEIILEIATQKRECEACVEQKQFESVNVGNNYLVENWIDRYPREAVSSIEVMRQLIYESLDLIDYSYSIDNSEIDHETVILSYENIDQSIEISASPISFKTVITDDSDYNELLHRDVEHALNRSLDTTIGNESIVSSNGAGLTVTDFDMLSFKSVTSTSRFSEYLSADNEFSSSQGKLIPTSSNINSVLDVSERKHLSIQDQNPPSGLDIQVLSGFSQDYEPFWIPDPINLFDSETGSMALDHNRGVASDELFASGRSTGSLESCLLDEDSMVPNWLFQIISQQQSATDELEPPAQLIVPLPPADDIYDENGNVVEGTGAGTGAGDGRGMHSDHSQDSSGRGTSISSSEVSSAVQSDGALVDPASGLVHYESLREDMNNAVAVAVSAPSGYPNGMRRPVASDMDADVSSFDADDVADSSDN